MSDLTNEHAAIVNEAKEFVSEWVRPYATEFEMNEAIPPELIRNMAAKGFLGASLPRKYGGLELDPLSYGALTEEFGKGCCSVRGLITVHTSLVSETVLRWGSEAQKQHWLPLLASGKKIAAFALTEPEVGSDAKSITTSYVKDGQHVIINGKKRWITCAGIADVYMVIARNGEKVSAFLVDRHSEGVTVNPMTGLLASRASHLAEIYFENVRVPEENMLGPEGAGFTYIVNTALDYGRYSIAWAGVAIAQEALEAMVSYSRKRSQFGKKLYNFQLIQAMIGNAVTKIHAARALCVKAGEMRKNKHEDAAMETSMAKYFSSKVAMEVATDAVQLHGGNGCSNEYPVERLFREAKILEIIEGTSQIQQEIISSYALKKYYVK